MRFFVFAGVGARLPPDAPSRDAEGEISSDEGIKFWTYGKSGGATFRKRLNKCVFLFLQVWVHDYHLMLLPAMLRERSPRMKVLNFGHMAKVGVRHLERD